MNSFGVKYRVVACVMWSSDFGIYPIKSLAVTNWRGCNGFVLSHVTCGQKLIQPLTSPPDTRNMQSLDPMMRSLWWRFTDYQIVELEDDSWYIRPSPGARLEPYAWLLVEPEEPLSSRQKLIGEHYQSLLNLELGSHSAILDWCRAYGLLGILPQQTVQITLAPRWMPIFEDHWPKVLSPNQVHYIRTNLGWRRTVEHSMAGKDSVIGEMDPTEVTRVIERFEDYINKLVDDPQDTVLPGPSAWVHPFPSIIGQNIELHQIQPIGAVVAPLFPDANTNGHLVEMGNLGCVLSARVHIGTGPDESARESVKDERGLQFTFG